MPESDRQPLYRPESQGRHRLGQIVLSQPMSMTVFASLAALLAVAGLVLACLIPWTRVITLQGQLRPDLGLVRLVASRGGQIRDFAVRPGQVVHRGDVVARIVDDGHNGQYSPGHADVVRQIELRRQSVVDEMHQREVFSRIEGASLDEKRGRLDQEIAFTDEQIRLQTQHVAYAQERVKVYADLATKGFISDMGRQQRDEELIEQQMHLSELRAARTRLAATRDSADFDLLSAQYRTARERESLLRELASATEAKARDRLDAETTVIAPLDGVVGSIDAQIGQAVTINDGLATVLPKGATLEAVCDVTPEEAASLRAGLAATIRFGVAPYRESGRVKATVVEVSDAPQPGHDKVVQRVRLRLEAQSFNLDHQVFALRPGASALVDVRLDRRPLLAWLFPATRHIQPGAAH